MEKREATIEEESKMSLEDIFRKYTKHGIVEEYDNKDIGFKDFSDDYPLDDDDEYEEEEDGDNDEESENDSDEDNNGFTFEIGWL